MSTFIHWQTDLSQRIGHVDLSTRRGAIHLLGKGSIKLGCDCWHLQATLVFWGSFNVLNFACVPRHLHIIFSSVIPLE